MTGFTQKGLSLPARAEATARTKRKFDHRPFDWATGATCLHLARGQAKNMGHHGLPIIPKLKGPNDALRALKAQGAATLADLLDQHFERLPAPAFALVGDLVMSDRPDDPLASIGIWDGVGNVFGWHDLGEDGLSVIKDAHAHLTVGWRL